jgi:hypothetical protein
MTGLGEYFCLVTIWCMVFGIAMRMSYEYISLKMKLVISMVKVVKMDGLYRECIMQLVCL